MIYLYDPPKDGNCLIWCLRIVMSLIRHELVNSFAECHTKLLKNHEFFKDHSSLDQSEIITALEYTDELVTYSTEGDGSSLESLDRKKCYLHLIGNHYYVILSQELGEIIELHQWEKIPFFLIPLLISVNASNKEEHSIDENFKTFSSHRLAYDIIENDGTPRLILVPKIKYILSNDFTKCLQILTSIEKDDEITNYILEGNIELKSLDGEKCYIRRKKNNTCSVILPDKIGEMLVRKQFTKIPLLLLNVLQSVEANSTKKHTETVINSGVNLVMLSANKISYDIKTIETKPPPYA